MEGLSQTADTEAQKIKFKLSHQISYPLNPQTITRFENGLDVLGLWLPDKVRRCSYASSRIFPFPLDKPEKQIGQINKTSAGTELRFCDMPETSDLARYRAALEDFYLSIKDAPASAYGKAH